MRKIHTLLPTVACGALLLTGCAGPEQKLGRGIRNCMEIVRWSSMQRSVEQTSLFDNPDAGVTTGVIKGFNQTIARTGMGVIDVVTFPIPLPSYEAWGTNVVPANVQYPDSYNPGMRSLQATMTDNHLGFAGGSLWPTIPGARFKVFDFPW